jgi:hypothetical protein
VSPRPGMQVDTRQGYRSASPNPYGGSQRSRTQSGSPQKRGSDQAYYRHNSPNDGARAISPAPYRDQQRASSGHVNSETAMQLAPGPEEGYGSQGRASGRSGGSGSSRPMSYYGGQSGQQGSTSSRQRSKSVADIRQFNRDGRPILHFGKSSLALRMHE